jgi:hypothetical protein
MHGARKMTAKDYAVRMMKPDFKITMENQTETTNSAQEAVQKTNTSKLTRLKRITFTQAEALAAEKGVKLTCETERSFYKNGRYTNTITDVLYKLSTLPDRKFSLLTDVRDFLLTLNSKYRA